MSPTREKTTQTALRLSVDLLERLDRIAHRWTTERPGMIATRSDVMRTLLLRAIDAEEKSYGRR